MSLNLSDIDKLPPAMRAQALADQARATAARERIMMQFASPALAAEREHAAQMQSKAAVSPLHAEVQALLYPPVSSPTPAQKTPARPTCAAAPWLPAAALHAIPAPNYGAPSGAQPQPPVLDAPVEPPQGEAFYAGRVHVRITSYRRRLLDPDNLTAKWFLDACRYSRLIRDDKPEDITYEVGQEKVARKEDERTEIVIEPIL